MIGNLLDNAVKFTPPSGNISVTLRRKAGQAAIEVSDSGVGIDQATLTRLFEPFAQADRSLDRSGGGLGLGLAIVKSMAELHGGHVDAFSEGPGRGARFTLSLPLAPQQATARDGRDGLPLNHPIARRRVLVIEDNTDLAETIASFLVIEGHEVAVTDDGKAGVAKAQDFLPEVVFCDLGLPHGMDGFAVARALRGQASTAAAYLVALSGYAQPEDRRRALEAGFDTHVAKPADTESLSKLAREGGPRAAGRPTIEPSGNTWASPRSH